MKNFCKLVVNVLIIELLKISAEETIKIDLYQAS